MRILTLVYLGGPQSATTITTGTYMRYNPQNSNRKTSFMTENIRLLFYIKEYINGFMIWIYISYIAKERKRVA